MSENLEELGHLITQLRTELEWAARTGAVVEQGRIIEPERTELQVLNDCWNLEQVQHMLGECTRCKLHGLGRKKIVFGSGNPEADLMFVGEGPGANEDRVGEPFVGKAGQLLTAIIEKGMGVQRSDVYIANIVKCRPPNNRDPEPDEVETCEPFLQAQIRIIKPKVIVTLGTLCLPGAAENQHRHAQAPRQVGRLQRHPGDAHLPPCLPLAEPKREAPRLGGCPARDAQDEGGGRLMRRLALLCCCVSAACGGEEMMPPPEEQPIPLEGLCAALAKADCERLAACGTMAPLDQASCELRQRALSCAPLQASLQADISVGSLAYFELAARACRDEVAALDCDVGFEHDLLALPGCSGMVEPLAEEGGACATALACGETLYCDPGAACPGTCKKLGQNNDLCGFDQPCAPELFCSLTGMRCRARIDLNGVCELALSGNACADGGFCDASQPGNPLCVPVRGRNQGCTNSFECIPGHRCITNRCSAGLEDDVCERDADCFSDFVCAAGRCAQPLAIDQMCAANGVACRVGLSCTSTTGGERCRPAPLLGGACDGECFLGRCVNGLCEALVEDGQSCGDMGACLPGRACDGQCQPPAVACSG